MKIISFYLPQFHRIPENDKWWGEGFTEWTTLKKAKPLFEGHRQPKVPLNNDYYNLLDPHTIDKQAKLAKQYGVYGWCIYHYWFSGQLLLEKPTEILLNNKWINIPFCLCWANESWTNGWVSKNESFLIKQENGNKEDWIKHFQYLLPYFKDERYIQKDGKPFFVIYRPELFPNIDEMISLWNELALKSGLNGICFSYQTVQKNLKTEDCFSYRIEYQPNYSFYDLNHNKHRILKAIKYKLTSILQKININIESIHPRGLVKVDYDEIWNKILNRMPEDSKSIPGAFVDWDNTPRKQMRGSLMVGYSVDKFRYYLAEQLKHAKNDYKSDMIFLFAWNEWTEGGYLEADIYDGFNRLKAIAEAIKMVNNDE